MKEALVPLQTPTNYDIRDDIQNPKINFIGNYNDDIIITEGFRDNQPEDYREEHVA